MLITPSALKEQVENPRWVIFDCRHDLADVTQGQRLYEEGHVPGAFFAAVETALSGPRTGRNGRHPLPSPDALADFLNQHGVTPETRIVAYDDVGGQYSARLWWLARWIGLSEVMVLDGGWPKWVAEGLPVTRAVPPARPRGSVVPRPNETLVCSSAELLAGLVTGEMLVLDARAPERYRGEVEPLDPVAGRIPAARNRFFKANLHPDLILRSSAELRREFETLLAGISPEQVVHQCGSGITACANLLAMERAGLTGSRLYAGSWSEWVSDPSRPVERG